MTRMLAALAALLVLGGTAAVAANPEPFNIQITIRQAITIAKVTDLDFGAVDTGAATYTVTPDAGPYPSAGTGAQAASFDIQGESGQTADILFGANPVSVDNGVDSRNVNLTTVAATHTFSGAVETFYVGGDITLDGLESTGVYTGNTTLSLVYQ